MKRKLLFFNGIVLFFSISNSVAQNSFVVSSGTNMVSTGEVTIAYDGGTWRNDGIINNREGTLVFTEPVSFAGNGSTNTQDFIIAHGGASNLYNRINVTGTLKVANGTLNANNQLTLVSNALGSAIIAPITAGSDIIGKVTVQRYIALGKNSFRFLTPSVTTDDFISNNWQLNTHISGSITGANGFDATPTGAASLYTYNNAQAIGIGWGAISNTNATNLISMQGYKIFIQGDRDVNVTADGAVDMNNPVTLSATGRLTIGTVVFDKSSEIPLNDTSNYSTDGYSLVGNPYVNTLDWNTLDKSNLSDAYYVWDANMGSSSKRGRYVVYSSATGITSNSASRVNEYIQPGQAFFVKNTIAGTAGSLTFRETDKIGSSALNYFYKIKNPSLSRLELQVYQSSELARGESPLDAAVVVFGNQFTNAIENGDATKLATGSEDLAFLNNNIALSIDARPEVIVTDELLVQLQDFQANKNYTFRTDFNNFDGSFTAYLFDNFLNQFTKLATTATTDVVFVTNADASSYGANRFKIVLQRNSLSIENFAEENISVYPNPITNNQFNISLPNNVLGEVVVKMFNALGQTIYETKTEDQKTVSIKPNSILVRGFYLVQIINQGKSITKKITVQ
jgi:hypothetical protein